MNLKFVLEDVGFQVNGKPVSFSVVHNMDEDAGVSFNDAVQSWIPRTKEYTAESLCAYIMSKGLHEVYALTEGQYKTLQSPSPDFRPTITTNDFINPVTNRTEELEVYDMEDGQPHKYLCIHDGEVTMVHVNDHAQWVGEDEMETALTKALGNLIEHHTT